MTLSDRAQHSITRVPQQKRAVQLPNETCARAAIRSQLWTTVGFGARVELSVITK